MAVYYFNSESDPLQRNGGVRHVAMSEFAPLEVAAHTLMDLASAIAIRHSNAGWGLSTIPGTVKAFDARVEGGAQRAPFRFWWVDADMGIILRVAGAHSSSCAGR